jgi:lipid-A-disaccharide synthase-like uncharacterized protein
MDWLHHLLWHGGKFLGVAWSAWKILGWTANGVFSARFLVQWYATEKRQQVVVPPLFWWLSLAGSLLFLAYALFYEKDSVFILAYAFNWIPYCRNLIIHARHEKSRLVCPECGLKAPAAANFCGHCGSRLPSAQPAERLKAAG